MMCTVKLTSINEGYECRALTVRFLGHMYRNDMIRFILNTYTHIFGGFNTNGDSLFIISISVAAIFTLWQTFSSCDTLILFVIVKTHSSEAVYIFHTGGSFSLPWTNTDRMNEKR